MPPYTKIRGTQLVDDSVTPDKVVYSLDDAYDNGGSGLGKFITASAGPVIIDAQNSVSQALIVTGALLVNGALSVSQEITGTLIGTSSFALDSNLLDGRDSTSFAGLTSNTYTGVQVFQTDVTGTNAYFSGNVVINGTASISLLETRNQQSLVVGDKFIVILSGAVDHTSLDGSGILFGSGSTGTSVDENGANAYLRYRNSYDALEIFPGLRASGSAIITGNLTVTGSSLLNSLSGTTAVFNSVTASSFVGTATTASYAQIAATASYYDTSSLLITSSISNSTITFKKGDNSEYSLTVNNVTNAQTASYSLLASTASYFDTSNLITTASVSNATITFTKGNNSTFPITVNNVTNAVSASIATSALTASSIYDTTASFPFSGIQDGQYLKRSGNSIIGSFIMMAAISIANETEVAKSIGTANDTYVGTYVFSGTAVLV